MKQAFRTLRKSPGFTLIAIFILTVAIGANLGVFATIDAFLLRPLPVDRPEQLVRICSLEEHGRLGQLPSPMLEPLSHDPALDGVCGVNTLLQPAEFDGKLRSIGVAGFTGNCFATLGVGLQAGRGIRESDNHLGAQPIAVITDALWRTQFAARADIVGQSMKVNGELFTIVGVTEPRFRGVLLGFPQDVMVPLLQTPVQLPNGQRPTQYWVNILARRAPGISQSQAAASVAAATASLLEASVPHRFNAAQRKQYLSQKLAVVAGGTGVDYFLRDRFGEPLYAILGVSAALLLIGCVNLASLLLARSLSRRREVAIRLALGARRRDIAGVLLFENALLLLIGAAFGIVLAFWTARAILAQGNRMFSNFSLSTGWDLRVFGFFIAALAFILAVFAVAALWQAGRLSRAEHLQESSRGVTATNTFAQKALAAAQIALTLALVAGSTLFAASLKHMYRIDFGFKPHGVWEALLSPRPGGYRNFAPDRYYRDLLDRIGSMPDVVSASLTDAIPFFNAAYEEPVATIENAHPGQEVRARVLGVSDRFFDTLGVQPIAGQDFRPQDDNSADPAVLISRSLAEYLAVHQGNRPSEPATDPRDLLGRHLRVGNETEYQRLRIIGIAPDLDMNLANLDESRPFTVYIDLWQHHSLQGYPVLLIRTAARTLAAEPIRRAVQQQGREYVQRFTSLDTEIDNALVENRMLAYLSSAFAVLALMLAAVGLFGLLSYQVANRTSEIGIRMALGAQRVQIQSMVLRHVTGLLLFGTLGGIALTLALQRVVRGLLFGVAAANPGVLAFSLAMLAASAGLGAWIPVQRASRIDPLDALRHE